MAKQKDKDAPEPKIATVRMKANAAPGSVIGLGMESGTVEIPVDEKGYIDAPVECVATLIEHRMAVQE